MPKSIAKRSLLLGAAVAAALVAGSAWSAPPAPVPKFAPTATVGGTVLHLNGEGTRFKAVFRVYDMALYTTKKVSTPEEILALGGAKRLHFIALRELQTADLGRLLMRGLADNSPEAQVRRHTATLFRFIDLFSVRQKLAAGETFSMEFAPGRGTQLFLDNKPVGDPIGDDEFFVMTLRIWFGPSPADRLLQQGLLGKDATER